jgi:hypothetical protein
LEDKEKKENPEAAKARKKTARAAENEKKKAKELTDQVKTKI